MISYPVRLFRTDEGKVRACFLDVPEAFAEGETEEDALFRATFVLEEALANYVLHKRPLPIPSDICGAPAIATNKFNLPAATAGTEQH